MNLLLDPTFRVVALGTAAIGIVAGILGTFAMLRRQSLLGDAVSHAALPGIVGAFMLTSSKSTIILILGAAVAGWTGALLVRGVIRSTRVKDDAALAVVLASFFGVGLVLLTFVQRWPEATQAGLNRFLFGQAATLLERDVWLIAGIGAVILLVVALLWKEFALLTFDPDLARTLGLPITRLDLLLTSLIVLAIVVGLQAVGVVLMSSALVAPAAAARQWTSSLGRMALLAGLFGGISGVAGAAVSAAASRVPTGPAIVVCASTLVIVSLLLAPHRGIVWRIARRRAGMRRHALPV
jgi:manganese/zinc/iron transport system permease protein